MAAEPTPPSPLSSTVAAEAAVARAAARARVELRPGEAASAGAWLRAEVEQLAAALGGVRVGPDGVAVGVGAGGMPLRADASPPHVMARPTALVAPASRLGYVLVPRLAPEPTDAAPPPRDARADDAFAAELDLGA